MTWTFTIYRIPGLHDRRCTQCNAAAVFHASTSNGVDHKTADLCQLCAELAAGKAGKKDLPEGSPPPTPSPTTGWR